MTPPGKTLAREYLRVSQDRSGRERSITEQQDDNRLNWPDFEFGEPYSDVSISASRYSAKTRGDYQRLTSDLEADKFSADVLVLWEGSRGSRRVGEWVTLIELCEDRGVRIAVTTEEHVYEPANPRDRKTLIDTASDAEYESAKISSRAKRAAAANAAAGIPHGPVPYGYRRHYDPVTRKFVAQEPEPVEAAVIRELFERVKRGHSVRSIALDFERRGVRSRPNKHGETRVFAPQHLRHFLNNATYAGKRVHIAGRRKDHNWDAWRVGELTQGNWEPLVDEQTWLAVRKILDKPRDPDRSGRATHLLSMIIRCDECGDVVIVSAGKREGGKYYRCRGGGHVQVRRLDADDLVEQIVVAYLASPKNIDKITANEGNGEALETARVEAARIRAERDDLADRLGRGEVSVEFAARAEPAIEDRLRAAERRVEELSTPSTLRGLIKPGKGVEVRWKASSIEVKRKILRILLAPEYLGEVRIKKGRRRPLEERIVWRRN